MTEIERLTQVVLKEARENGAESACDYGDAEQIVKALLAALRASAQSSGDGGDLVTVPREPTEEMWGGLARDLIMWDRGMPNQYGSTLYQHLRSSGRVIPAWLEAEIPDTRHTPPKGTVAVCIFKAMVEAAPPARSAAMTDEPATMRELTPEEARTMQVALLNSSALAYEITPEFAAEIEAQTEGLPAVERLRAALRLATASPSTATSAEPVATIDNVPSCGMENDYRRAAPIEVPRMRAIAGTLPATPPSSGNADAVREIIEEIEINWRVGADNKFSDVQWGVIKACLLAALSSAPVAGEWPTREQIARSIDPRAFDGWQGLYDANLEKEGADFSKRCADAWYGEKKEAALKTADAVLAYFVPRNQGEGGGPRS